ncbi:uncharacterized protein [Primulina eburnea]|uniref:uncharacterized protein n=1 Tax=Primulina eburnea TaxID=1245227 RepID=UPI003C6C3E5C
MAGVALLLDFLRKNPSFSGQQVHPRSLLSNTLAASFAVSTPFAYRALFGNGETHIAYCDAGLAVGEDYLSNIWTPSGSIFRDDTLKHSTKTYNIEMKPLFSAFHWKALALTSLRSFVLFYLPLLEPQSPMEEDDGNFLQENPYEARVDLIVPFKKSVKQICRETTVVTTRRVLERLAVHYISQRMAWKLLKDAPKSATRKAGRGMTTSNYVICVSRTTFRGHFLGVLASWFVQVGIDIYRFFTSMYKNKEASGDTANTAENFQILGKKIYGTTIRCSASLVFASIGAGIGAAVIRPSTGQWIGCALGDMAGPIIISFCFEKLCIDL